MCGHMEASQGQSTTEYFYLYLSESISLVLLYFSTAFKKIFLQYGLVKGDPAHGIGVGTT